MLLPFLYIIKSIINVPSCKIRVLNSFYPSVLLQMPSKNLNKILIITGLNQRRETK